MKVALIQCPVWGTREPPLAIVQLAGCLKSRGIDTKSFDFNNYLYRNRSGKVNTLWAWEQCMSWYDPEWVEDFFRDYSPAVEDFSGKLTIYDPDIAGFSVSASTYESSRRLSLILKKLKPDIKIIFGGPAFIDESYIKRALEETGADYVIAQEADDILCNLVDAVDLRTDLSKVPGIFMMEDSRVISTGKAVLPVDLNNLAYMDFDDLRIEDYDDTVHLSLMSSRGCIWRCAYCSTCSFNEQYRMMSAERIHQEITFHRSCNYDMHRKDNMGHVDFMDLEFNGDIKRLREFSELMIKYPPCSFLPRMKWVANAVIHPGLTKEMLELMAAAGCKKLIFGIESGSPEVLQRMRKPYDIEVAKRIMKDAFEAGIQVTNNFMFGFPGETERDFDLTLDYIKEVGHYLERAYPSRTYCAVEQFSYMERNLDKFNIRQPVNHHLYWETLDGKNTYPVRLERCAKFERLCEEIGVLVDCGVKTSVDMDNWYNLGYYYEYTDDYGKACEYFLKYLAEDPENKNVIQKLEDMYRKKPGSLSEDIISRVKRTVGIDDDGD